jgi:hypothetical protein
MRKITMGWVHLGNVKYDVKAGYSHLGLDLYIFCHIPACAIADSTKPPADFSTPVFLYSSLIGLCMSISK